MKKAKHIKKLNALREYSKKVLALMIVLWFAGALFGMSIIVYQAFAVPEYLTLDSLLNYIGLPMTGGIVGYLVKSAVENKQKIINQPPELENEITEDCER